MVANGSTAAGHRHHGNGRNRRRAADTPTSGGWPNLPQNPTPCRGWPAADTEPKPDGVAHRVGEITSGPLIGSTAGGIASFFLEDFDGQQPLLLVNRIDLRA